MKCECGSFAINPNMNGRDDSDLDLCDVCYWKKRAKGAKDIINWIESNQEEYNCAELINKIIDKLAGLYPAWQ